MHGVLRQAYRRALVRRNGRLGVGATGVLVIGTLARMHRRSGAARPCTNTFLGFRPSATCLFLAALASLVGCANFDRIDRQIDRLVKARSSELGESASPPRLAPPEVSEDVRRDAYEKTPETVNPDVEAMDIPRADPARDVSERLENVYAEREDALAIDLERAFRIAQETSRQFITAEEDYILVAIRLLIERHDWNPRFFNTLSASLDFEPEDATGEDFAALNVINDLRVTQRLPYGGDFEAAVITTATQRLTEVVGENQTNTSELRLSLDFPLMRDAGLIAQEQLIQAERDLVYAARDFERFRRTFLVDIASSYFSLVAQKASLVNQERRLESVQVLFDQTQAFVDAGRSSPFELQNVRQNLLSSTSALINARESYQIAKDFFKIDLGLPVTTPIQIVPSQLDVVEPDVSLVEAARTALAYRLDYQTDQDVIGDQRRAVKNARNQLLPDLDVNLEASFFTDDDPPDFVSLDRDGQSYTAGVTFGLPLDRRIERLQLRQSIIGIQRAKRNLEETRDRLVLDARAAVREIDRARLALRLQSQSVEANLRRQRELELKADEVTAQDRLDAQNELLQTQNARDAAQRDLNNAILNFLLVTGQMRVDRDGAFKPPKSLVAVLESDPLETEVDPDAERVAEEATDPPLEADDDGASGDEPVPGVTEPDDPGETPRSP